ncbi:hypothetical protein EN871_09865 [bacterium M00.F.Ca.ET.228.01.1.1]|nr:hypothetical protein EN871_09865 [bacterium M00.F.Ca.ET.228.01.1.1]TGS02761.1 hypothetical protein EN834_09860 [bacterium M00.F.Ca.ET.191.01.1.1]TGU06143.1 hypothetical protein EN798_13940 [bacterium M00.F.Ca.ET.155.01.1.1]
MPFKKPSKTASPKNPSAQAVQAHALGNKEACAAVINAIRKSIQPTTTGLTALVVNDKHLVDNARKAIEKLYMCFDNIAGIPAPDAAFMSSLHSGNVQTLDELYALAELENLPDTALERTFYSCGSRPNFNFLGNEGLHMLLPIIEDAENGWVTLAQSCDSLSPEHLIAGMCQIRATAEKAEAYVLLIIVCPGKERVPGIRDFCDEYLEVDACESDPGAHLAFSIEALRLADMHGLGYGKVICNVTLTDDGYLRTFEPFISTSLRDRFIWKLRASGKSLAEIGELVDLHKSSVKRCLDGMRPVRRQKLSDEEIAQHLDALDVGGGSVDKSTKLPDEDTEDFA